MNMQKTWALLCFILINNCSYVFSRECTAIDSDNCYVEEKFRNAAENGNLKVIEQLLNKVDINAQDEHGRTALSLAVAHGHDLIVRALLNNLKTNVNTQSSYDGTTALMVAIMFSSYSMVELLLGAENIDLTIKNNNGQSALVLVTQLLANGNSSNIIDEHSAYYDDIKKQKLILKALNNKTK